MALPSQPPAMDYLHAWFQIPVHDDLLRIAPSSVVDMVEQYHTNNPGQYLDPNYDSYYMNYAPTSYLSQLPTLLQWNIQEEIYVDMFAHAARNSYPGYNSTINPMHTTSSLNPHATHFQEIYQYPDPNYDSYYMNHAPTSSLSQPTTRNIQEQLYLNMFGHAARNSYPGDNFTINPMHTSSSLNPHATHYQEIDHHLIIDDFDVAEEFDDWEWSSDDDQETATAPDSIVDWNIRWQDEESYKDLKTRRSREEDEIQGDICVVCHDDLYEKENDDETIATLNCGHEYHTHCIKRWLQLKNVCPLCNATALPQH